MATPSWWVDPTIPQNYTPTAYDPNSGRWVTVNSWQSLPENGQPQGYDTAKNPYGYASGLQGGLTVNNSLLNTSQPSLANAWFDPASGNIYSGPGGTVLGNIKDTVSGMSLDPETGMTQFNRFGSVNADTGKVGDPLSGVQDIGQYQAWHDWGYDQVFGDIRTAPLDAIQNFSQNYNNWQADQGLQQWGQGGGQNAAWGLLAAWLGGSALAGGLGAGAGAGEAATTGGTLAGPTASGLTLDTVSGLAGPTASGLPLSQALGSEALPGLLSGPQYAALGSGVASTTGGLSDLLNTPIPPIPPTSGTTAPPVDQGLPDLKSGSLADPYATVPPGTPGVNSTSELLYGLQNLATTGAGSAVNTAARDSLISKIINGTATASDWTQLAGLVGSTALGAIGSSQQSSALTDIYNQMRADRAPALSAFNTALQNPNTFYNSAPAMGATDAVLRKLSVNGNPALNPGDLSKAAAYNLGGYNSYLSNLAGPAFGGEALQANLLTNAAQANNGIYGQLSGLLGATTTPQQQGLSLTDLQKLIGNTSNTVSGLGNLSDLLKGLTINSGNSPV